MLHDAIDYWYTVPLCELAAQLYLAHFAARHTRQIAQSHELLRRFLLRTAPIFEVADIGLAGDLFQVVPELERFMA